MALAFRLDLIDTEGLAAIAALFVPDFVEYRAGVFGTDEFEAENVDVWFEHNAGDVASLEAVVNHVHPFDVVTDTHSDDQPGDLWSVAIRLADTWRALLVLRFPDRDFEVSCVGGYGPEASFFQVVPGQ